MIFTIFIVIIINLWKYERMKVYVLVQRYIINFHYSYTIGCTGLSWLLDAFGICQAYIVSDLIMKCVLQNK